MIYSRTLMGGADAVLFKTTVDEIVGTVPSEPANVTAKAGDQMVNLTWDPPEDLGGVGLRGFFFYDWSTCDILSLVLVG